MPKHWWGFFVGGAPAGPCQTLGRLGHLVEQLLQLRFVQFFFDPGIDRPLQQLREGFLAGLGIGGQQGTGQQGQCA